MESIQQQSTPLAWFIPAAAYSVLRLNAQAVIE